MNYFFNDLSQICRLLLPIIGLAVLIVLIIVLIKISKLLDTTNVTIEKTHGSIKLVEETLSKAQEPVDTVVKVAKSIDKAHDASIKAIDDAKEYVIKNIEQIKNRASELNDKLSKKEVEEIKELKEPSPDDILKGE